ncbi:MerR family transcriptional regulator [Nakamurella silvestris]|nr:MerR family transcriptional regulator [Nakamurella silvestris]
MRIGELGQQTGVSTRTLRYYESLGLLRGRRSSNGYRVYTEEDLREVAEIRALVDLGFALEETRPFVECLRSGHEVAGSCADSLAVYRRKIAEVDSYTEQLARVRAQLVADLEVAEERRNAPAAPPRCEFSINSTPAETGPVHPEEHP